MLMKLVHWRREDSAALHFSADWLCFAALKWTCWFQAVRPACLHSAALSTHQDDPVLVWSSRMWRSVSLSVSHSPVSSPCRSISSSSQQITFYINKLCSEQARAVVQIPYNCWMKPHSQRSLLTGQTWFETLLSVLRVTGAVQVSIVQSHFCS